MKTNNSKENLCDKCEQCFANCDGQDIEFGDGIGHDNVVKCSGFIERKVAE